MSIWKRLWSGSALGRIAGGWRTYGPDSPAGVGAFASNESDGTYGSVTDDQAMKLSAFHGCVSLRSEVFGSLPLHLRDQDKNLVRDHDLYDVLHSSPNAMQTAAEYWSMMGAMVDIYGNAISVVQRRTRDKSVISLEPYTDVESASMAQEKSGRWYYDLGGEKFDVENILHLKGFTVKGLWGMPLLEIGRHILSAQLTANEFAMRQFRQGTKVGGFFEPDRDLDPAKLEDFNKRMAVFNKAENAGRWMVLLKGMKPIGGQEFRAKAADAELLQSRYFGIEEICRLCRVPPQLIGHSDKASSWASSLEHINLFFLMYSMQPTIVRMEQRITKTLLSTADRVKRLQPKFSIQGLMRSDLKTRQAFYASALQNGYYNRDEVRDLEDRGQIEGGERYTVQLNMTDVGKLEEKEPTQ